MTCPDTRKRLELLPLFLSYKTRRINTVSEIEEHALSRRSSLLARELADEYLAGVCRRMYEGWGFFIA